MKKAELKNLLLAKFESRLSEIRTKYNALIIAFSRDMDSFIAEYGDLAKEEVREMFIVTAGLLPDKMGVSKRRKSVEQAEEAQPEKKAKREKKHRRKRQPRKPGEPTILEVLRKRLPAYLAQVGSGGKEFTTREVFEAMEKTGLPDKRISHANVSLYLGQHGKEHSLASETRKVKKRGAPMPIVTRFFRIVRRGRKKVSGRATRQAMALVRGLVVTEFKGKVFTPPQMAASLKKNYSIVLRNIHSNMTKLAQAGLIKRVGKGQYQA